MLLSQRASRCQKVGSQADEHLRRLVHSFLQVGSRPSKGIVACSIVQRVLRPRQAAAEVVNSGRSMRRRPATSGGGRTRGWCARWSRSCLSARVTRRDPRRLPTCRGACWCGCRRSFCFVQETLEPCEGSASM